MYTDFIRVNDIIYGNHERHKLDIFIPEKIKSDSGIILFIHGGGWNQGDKSGHHHDMDFFSRNGYICASMNYRFVTDEITVFDELDDITSALKTIKLKCSEYGFNIDKMILSGASAGGHLSLMYAYCRKEESPVSPVAACVYCPPVDCASSDFLLGISGEFEEWKYGILSKCCGVKICKNTLMNKEQQEALNNISPKTYISSNCVPTAIFQGKFDELVPFEQVSEFLDLLDKKGIKNDLVIYQNSGHALDKDPEAAIKAREIFKTYCEFYLK